MRPAPSRPLADLYRRFSQFEDVTDGDGVFGQADGRKVLAERTRTIEQFLVADLFCPACVMLEGVMMNSLSTATMPNKITLCVTFETGFAQ